MLPIFTAIKERLNSVSAKFNAAGFPAVKHVDLDKGQYLQPELHEIFPLPAVFYSSTVDWSTTPGNVQKGTAIIETVIVLQSSASAAYGSSTLQEAEKVLAYHSQVHKYLQGLKGVCFTSLKRLRSGDVPVAAGFYAYATTYQCEVTDSSTHLLSDYVEETMDDVVVTRKPLEPYAPKEETGFIVDDVG
ncbi:hypothetical protein [Algivirga pacifica]|uniref:Gp37 protein n=1 Tax=Algivirga pacifica TaxID=1162670 RepID=A0ABP9D782_9BACT